MTPLRVLFADDEPTARKRMRRLLEAIEGVEVVAECASGEDALRELDRLDVDVALLDVRMGAVSGLDVSRAAEDLGVEIVFTTAHDAHAVEAFARGAVDYVRKPIDAPRLDLAITRARRRIESARAPSRTPAEALDRIAFEVRGASGSAGAGRGALPPSPREVRLLAPSEISHALLDGELVRVFTERESLLTERTLSELEPMLGPQFVRVHRRALLALAHVERLRPLPSGGYVAMTRAGHEVPVARQAARALRRQLGIG